MATAYAMVYTRDPHSEWPADIGDDPAIVAASGPGPGVITWGICRRRVRNRVQPGDLVIFFAADSLRDQRPARYHWIGYATVDRKVSQLDVWEAEELAGFRGYPNLLIRPEGTGYRHSEHEHRDWIWRLTDMPGVRARDFENLEARQVLREDSRVGRQLVQVVANHVIFSPEHVGTFIATDPPLVAHANENGRPEEWGEGPVTAELHKLILGSGATRTRLRTRNKVNPHTPPPGLRANADELRQGLNLWLRRHGIQQRTIHGKEKVYGSIP